MLTVPAYAKINLTLEVLGRHTDGYHEVATVLQQIDLKDTLSFQQQHDLSLDCDHPDLQFLSFPQEFNETFVPVEPTEDKRTTIEKHQKSPNLVLEAAKLLQEVTGTRQGAAISIKKGIPIAAGLGGGASDAAATLQALNELWGLGLSLGQLMQLASRLGSDAAFFLYGGTALGEGRGERVSPLPPFPSSWVVLLRPPVDIPSKKTERLYSFLDPSCFSKGKFTREVVALLRQGRELPPSSFYNTFERIAFTAYTGLEEHWQRFNQLGAGNVHLAGSGPTIFTMVRDRAQGEELYRSFRSEGLEAYLVQTMVGR
jgi:4-diphosphocytidyl-2-C-methyl-D-erythritol kinase